MWLPSFSFAIGFLCAVAIGIAMRNAQADKEVYGCVSIIGALVFLLMITTLLLGSFAWLLGLEDTMRFLRMM